MNRVYKNNISEMVREIQYYITEIVTEFLLLYFRVCLKLSSFW